MRYEERKLKAKEIVERNTFTITMNYDDMVNLSNYIHNENLTISEGTIEVDICNWFKSRKNVDFLEAERELNSLDTFDYEGSILDDIIDYEDSKF